MHRDSFRNRSRRAFPLPNHQSLRSAGKVDKAGFELGEEVEAFLGHLALADAGCLAAAERELRFASRGKGVASAFSS